MGSPWPALHTSWRLRCAFRAEGSFPAAVAKGRRGAHGLDIVLVPFLALGDRKPILSCLLTFSPKDRVGFLTPEICGCTVVVQFTLDIEGVVLFRIHTGNLELHALYLVFLESKTNVQFLPLTEGSPALVPKLVLRCQEARELWLPQTRQLPRWKKELFTFNTRSSSSKRGAGLRSRQGHGRSAPQGFLWH